MSASSAPMSAYATGQSAHSMTGFARVSGRVSDTLGFTLSLKSVNHRFLDLHLRLPSGLDSLEMQIRRILKQRLVRGHVEVTLTLDRGQRTETSYNTNLIAGYIQVFREVVEAYGLSGEPDLNSILRLPAASWRSCWHSWASA